MNIWSEFNIPLAKDKALLYMQIVPWEYFEVTGRFVMKEECRIKVDSDGIQVTHLVSYSGWLMRGPPSGRILLFPHSKLLPEVIFLMPATQMVLCSFGIYCSKTIVKTNSSLLVKAMLVSILGKPIRIFCQMVQTLPE